MYRQALLLTFLLMLVSACADVEVRPLKAEEKLGGVKYYNEGVRFFRPWPYLWITVGEKGVCQMSITYLPQMEEEYIIIPHPRMGSVTMNPTLTNGWSLTSFSSAADSKASEMVTAIGNLTAAAAGAAGGGVNFMSPAEQGTQFGPGMYQFEFDTTGFVSNLKPIFLQKGADKEPVKCKDVTPPTISGTSQPQVPAGSTNLGK
jgi:hypothetical protein